MTLAPFVQGGDTLILVLLRKSDADGNRRTITGLFQHVCRDVTEAISRRF